MLLFRKASAQFVEPLRSELSSGEKSVSAGFKGKKKRHLNPPANCPHCGKMWATRRGKSARSFSCFFHTGPAPSSKPAASPNLPRKSLLGQLPYEGLIVATQRLTEANTGELLSLPFSVDSVLVFDMSNLCF